MAFEMWGALFCLIAMLCVIFSYMKSKKEKRYLICLMLFGGLWLLNDALAWYYRGVQGTVAYYMVYLANFLAFLFTDVVLLLSTVYIAYRAFGDPRYYQSKRVVACMYIVTVDLVMQILNLFFHEYFYIDVSNLYHRGALSFLFPLLASIVLAVNFSVLITERRKLSKRMFTCLYLCIILPIVAAIYQYTHYGVSYTCIALVFALINLFVNVMAEQGEMVSKEAEQLNDMKVELLISQIGPHFIYNTLSTIKHLCRKDPAQAEETIDAFSVYLRGNLNSLQEKKMIPFKDELSHVHAYLVVEKKRFGERLNVVEDIQYDDFLIPALTLQPLVENAVKHGVCAKESGGTIVIRSECVDNIYEIHIDDDGAGFDQKNMTPVDSSIHVGIKNVEERLRSMCHGTLTIESQIDQGTKVTIRIPKAEGKKK